MCVKGLFLHLYHKELMLCRFHLVNKHREFEEAAGR